jgi:hypothetical protein
MKLSIQQIVVVFASISLPAGMWAAENRIDVSTIITKADAKSVLGVDVRDAATRSVQGGDGYYSKCNYYSVAPGKTLLIRVYQAAAGYDAQKEFELVTKDTPGVKPVTGLGDKALVASGSAGGLPARVTMLYVMKKNALITIGLGGLADESAVVEKAKTAAEKILAQL